MRGNFEVIKKVISTAVLRAGAAAWKYISPLPSWMVNLWPSQSFEPLVFQERDEVNNGEYG